VLLNIKGEIASYIMAGTSYFLMKWLYLFCTRLIPLVFRLLTDFVCLLIYEFCLSLRKIARCSVILLLPLFKKSYPPKQLLPGRHVALLGHIILTLILSFSM